VPVHHERANGRCIRSPIILKPNEQLESTLSDPHFRELLAYETDAHSSNDIAGRETGEGCGSAIDADPELWQPG
jgi:hypothetical protein